MTKKKKVEELGIPIIFDCILNRPTPLKDQLPLLYDDVASLIPNTPIIFAHMGGFRFLDTLIVANKNKNVYLDTSITLECFYKTPFQEQVRFVFEKVGYDRVIFGSDFPEKGLGNFFGIQNKSMGPKAMFFFKVLIRTEH